MQSMSHGCSDMFKSAALAAAAAAALLTVGCAGASSSEARVSSVEPERFLAGRGRLLIRFRAS